MLGRGSKKTKFHNLTTQTASYFEVLRVVNGANLFFSIVYVDRNASFFVADEKTVKKCVLASPNKLVTSKQTSGNRGTLLFLIKVCDPVCKL